MPVWNLMPVDVQPAVRICDWRVFEVQIKSSAVRTRHLVGSDVRAYDGSVSSAIEAFDAATRRGVTDSGRVYALVGKGSGIGMNAEYVWNNWKDINGATDVVDVTAEVEALLESLSPAVRFVEAMPRADEVALLAKNRTELAARLMHDALHTKNSMSTRFTCAFDALYLCAMVAMKTSSGLPMHPYPTVLKRGAKQLGLDSLRIEPLAQSMSTLSTHIEATEQEVEALTDLAFEALKALRAYVPPESSNANPQT